MIVGNISVTTRSFSGNPVISTVPFSDMARAKAEFDRVADLIRQDEVRANDKPPMVEIEGDGVKVTMRLVEIGSISLTDFAFSNEQEAGVRDAFPHLFKR